MVFYFSLQFTHGSINFIHTIFTLEIRLTLSNIMSSLLLASDAAAAAAVVEIGLEWKSLRMQ